MKEFIKSLKGKQLQLITIVSFFLLLYALNYSFFSSSGDKLYGNIVYVPNKAKSGNLIISTRNGIGSAVSDVNGLFQLPLAVKKNKDSYIYFTPGGKDKVIVQPPDGLYLISEVKSNLEIRLCNKGNDDCIFSERSQGSLNEDILNYRVGRRIQRGNDNDQYNNALSKMDQDFQLLPGTSKKRVKEISKKGLNGQGALTEVEYKLMSGDGSYNEEVLKEQFSTVNETVRLFRDGEVSKESVFEEKYKLAKILFLFKKYKQSLEVYQDLLERWSVKSQKNQLRVDILTATNYHQITLGKDYIPPLLEKAYLDEINYLSALSLRDFFKEAIVINDLSFYVSKDPRISRKKYALELLNTAPLKEIQSYYPELALTILNNKLAISTEVAKNCEIEALDQVLHEVILYLEGSDIKSSITLLDIPYNIIAAVSKQADCSVGHSAVMRYENAFSVLDKSIASPYFSRVATAAENIEMRSKYCELKRRISDLSSASNALDLLNESIKCYDDLLSSPLDYSTATGQETLAELKRNLGYSLYRSGMHLTGRSRATQLTKSNHYLTEAGDYYKSKSEHEALSNQIINTRGFNLVNIADSSDISEKQKQEEFTVAKELIIVAYQSDKDNPSFKDSLGWAEFKLGNLEAAERLFLSAASDAKQRRDKIEIHSHLSELYISRGDYDLAKQQINEIAKANPQAIEIRYLNSKIDGAGSSGNNQ